MLGEEGEEVVVGYQSKAVGTQTLSLRGFLLICPYWRNRKEQGRMTTQKWPADISEHNIREEIQLKRGLNEELCAYLAVG